MRVLGFPPVCTCGAVAQQSDGDDDDDDDIAVCVCYTVCVVSWPLFLSPLIQQGVVNTGSLEGSFSPRLQCLFRCLD